MTSTTQLSTAETLEKLETARKIALSDPNHYTRLIPSLLPALGPKAALELRRWGTELLVEGLSCPALAPEQREQLALAVLKTLKEYLDTPSEDTAVIKNIVQAATSTYPLIYKHIIFNQSDPVLWQDMSAVKSNILKRETTAPSGIKVCCVKFIQRIVQVQTPDVITDPRRPDQNDLSLALVPPEHPVLSPSHLQAEAFGLLDRMLSVFQDASPSDALLVTATLNSVGVLVRTRPAIANRILNAIFSFNPFRDASATASIRVKIVVKSMERTIRAFLINLNKRNPSGPMAGRISGYLDHLQQVRAEVLQERGRKRSPPTEPTDGLDNAKRQRLGAEVSEAPPPHYPVLAQFPGGHCTVADVFMLSNDPQLKGFDAHSISLHLIQQVTGPLLRVADNARLFQAVDDVRARWQYLKETKPPAAEDAAKSVIGLLDDEEEYQPDEGAEQIPNQIVKVPLPIAPPPPPAIKLVPFTIPQPPPLSHDDAIEYGKGAVTRVFEAVSELDEPSSKAPKSGFNRVAASNHDRDSWITVVSRLATRSLSGLDTSPDPVKTEDADGTLIRAGFFIGDTLRESMFRYVLDDWRKRLDIAVSWLNEEWYNDKVSSEVDSTCAQHYERWALRVFDGILPYLDAKDKVLIRFLSEIPSVTGEIMERVKRLARDPERVSLAVNAIHYLTLFRPPVRAMCIDALEDLYTNYDDAKASTTKLLQKWRPALLVKVEQPRVEDDIKSPAPTRTSTPVAA